MKLTMENTIYVIEKLELEGKVQLLITSPPYPLNKKIKIWEYGRRRVFGVAVYVLRGHRPLQEVLSF